MTTSVASGPRRKASCHVRKLTNGNMSLNRQTHDLCCSRFSLLLTILGVAARFPLESSCEGVGPSELVI